MPVRWRAPDFMIIAVDTNIDFVLTDTNMNARRGYTMTARAQAVEATRTSILDAVIELARERLLPDIALDDVAARAGVSVQTVLRHFGSRDALFDAAIAHGQLAAAEERRAPRGDVEQALRVLMDHYEKQGRGVLLLLAQEQVGPSGARDHRQRPPAASALGRGGLRPLPARSCRAA